MKKKQSFKLSHNVSLLVVGVLVAATVMGTGINVYRNRNSMTAQALSVSLGSIDTGYSKLSGSVCKTVITSTTVFARITIIASMPMTSGYYTMQFWGRNGTTSRDIGRSTSWVANGKTLTHSVSLKLNETLRATLYAPSNKTYNFPGQPLASTIPTC